MEKFWCVPRTSPRLFTPRLYRYHFDVWYVSDPSSEVQRLLSASHRYMTISELYSSISNRDGALHQVYLLAAVNAIFVFLLFVAFTVTGSLTSLSGFEAKHC